MAKVQPATPESGPRPLREGRHRRPRVGDIVRIVLTLSHNNRSTVGRVGAIAEDYHGDFPYKIEGIDEWRYAEAEVVLAEAQAFEHVVSESSGSVTESETSLDRQREHSSRSPHSTESEQHGSNRDVVIDARKEVDDSTDTPGNFRAPKRTEVLQKYQMDMDGDWSVFDIFCNCSGNDCGGAGGRRVSDIQVAPPLSGPALPATAMAPPSHSRLRESPVKAPAVAPHPVVHGTMIDRCEEDYKVTASAQV